MAVRRLGSSKTGWATTCWVDPGGNTGWAVMSVNPEDLVSTRKPLHKCIQHWSCGDTGKKNHDQMASEMLEFFDMWDDAAIGIERFNLRQLAVELSPVTVTAKIEYGLWLAEKWTAAEEERDVGRPRLVWKQDPGMAKNKLTDDRQREYGLWVPGLDHQRDALKHCYTFLSRVRERPRMRATAWPNLFKIDGDAQKRRPPTNKRRLI
jgi:hypothetical protein